MKFFHLSDLHIGLKLFQRDLQEDQRHIFRQIAALAAREQPDAVVVAGDLYDKAVPSAESVQLFDEFLALLTQAVPGAVLMLISGNHDSAARLNVFRFALARQRIHMIGQPPRTPEERIQQVTLEDAFGPVTFWLLPFVKPSMVKQIVGADENGNNLSYDASVRALLAREHIDQTRRNVLVSHQFYLPPGQDPAAVERMDSEVCTVGNIDSIGADVLEPFDYAALGHIHKPMTVGKAQYRYCGTPLACSVSEAGQQKGVIQVELGEKGDVRTTVLPLEPLRRVRILTGTLAELLAQGCEDYVTAVLTDPVDLDVFDLQDRLRAAFPNLLEIRRQQRGVDYGAAGIPEAELDPYELCCAFLQDLDQEERAILQDVLQEIQEVEP